MHETDLFTTDREIAPGDVLDQSFIQFCQNGGHATKYAGECVLCIICCLFNILYKMKLDIRTERRRFLLYSDLSNIGLFRKSTELQ